MKLYISYYESYVSIIEGRYNKKKDKFNIKNCILISSEDVGIDYNDKYGLLREALKVNKSKVKDVVLCLNTKDVIIKSTETHKVEPKDLDGIMNNEMDEIMSLDYDSYTFSYEVTKEGLKDDKENLDIVVAAIANDELEKLLDIFKEFKLNLERIDTISTAYCRLLKKIEYNNIMMLNVGSYGSIVNIFKEDSLFIHDNIPVKINESSNHYVYSALIEEVNGLINYYCSRNYGNDMEMIVLVGENNEDIEIKDRFNNEISANVVYGIENLFDIENDISGNLSRYEISRVCDILGSMCVCEDNKQYSKMNLLPEKLRNKQKSKNAIRKAVKMAPIALAIIGVPYIAFGAIDSKVQNKIEESQVKLEELTEAYGDIEKINSEMGKIEEEIEVYQTLSNKEVKWADILNSINRKIPYRAELTNMNVYYDSSLVESDEENTEQSEESSTSENTEQQETPLYDQIPNTIVLDGEARNSYQVGQFVYNLNQASYFESVKLKNITENQEKGVQQFNIILVLKEGAVHGE